MIGVFFKDRVCSALVETVEEAEAKIVSDGHKDGEYVLRQCEFRPDIMDVYEQLLEFKPGNLIAILVKKGSALIPKAA